MGNTDFAGLFIYAFVFGGFFAVMYDIMWVVRVSVFRNRFIWLTDLLSAFSVGILIAILQYNFSSGKFRFLPYVIFPIGALCVRFTFSRILRLLVDRLIQYIRKTCFGIKIKIHSRQRMKYLLFYSSRGFGLVDK